MGKDERIILVIGGVALAAILLYHMTELKVSNDVADNIQPAPEFKLVPDGIPNYMVYNQPFLFSPPVANILPATASGILGQSFTQPPSALAADDNGQNWYS